MAAFTAMPIKLLPPANNNITNTNPQTYEKVCVSPFYQENGRAKYMDELGKMLQLFNCRHSFEKHTEDWNKSFSCQMRIYVSMYY